MKRLVIACDGTWNKADQQKDGKPCPTNVCKVAQRIAEVAPDGVRQEVYYAAGVGTEWGERLRGGAFGFGLSREVQKAYRFLVDHFEEGDEIFFFGFSRGAFTVRSTAGLVRNAGILRREHRDLVGEAYELYRDRERHPDSEEARRFRAEHSIETRIRFIGVWDTVGALGVPLDGLRFLNLINRRWEFHDLDLSSRVDSAFHAVAIDEQRGPFKAALWNQSPEGRAKGQELEQVWFAGVHSDVGGGYPRSGLADLALEWMVDRARRCGLGFDLAPALDLDEALADTLHDSRTWFYKLLKPAPRVIGRVPTGRESVASTAVQRHERGVDGYAPATLLDNLAGRPVVTDIRGSGSPSRVQPA
ncbi:DUF2235 domain-containing protein [Nocardioides caldifontis]|uniref:DUF2235 domain-containing protein n=1 Tax=Nocardioides caldifontis TaxID=2588938 RepID=UPI0011DF521E|nr:DUF2235 domain-containing protein [Nocardioides caldifontis]